MTNALARLFGLIIAASLLAACGGGSSSGGSDNTGMPPANRAPSIGGTPLTSVTVGEGYAFTPSASDPDGDRLTFSILNQPAWAAFDAASGALTGIPAEANIGTTSSVTISVTDGDASVSLGPFDVEVRQVWLGSATVSWAIPSTNADGSTLTDLAGFRVHFGTVSNDYSVVVEIDDPSADSVLIDELQPGTYFFAVTAVDRADNESAFSAEASKVVQP